jgi:hypothetical protein
MLDESAEKEASARKENLQQATVFFIVKNILRSFTLAP